MPRGAAPGERRGGRAKGTPNKKTVERQIIAAQIKQARIAEQTLAAPKPEKLGRQVLHDFMELFAGLAAKFQPWPDEFGINPREDPALFEKYARLALDAARWLAPYQSAKLAAIAAMMVPTPAPAPEPKTIEGRGDNVINLHDANEASKIYQRTVQAVR